MGDHNQKIQAVMKLLNIKKTDKKSDTLKANRLYAEELEKRSPEYRLNAKTKKQADVLSNKRKLKEETAKAQPESGTEAIDRILGELKGVRGNVVNASGSPLYPDDFQPRDKAFEKSPYYNTGLPGSISSTGVDRIKELEGQLAVAKSAKESGKSYPESKRNQEVQDKFLEYIKFFNKQGVDEKKVRYLAELQTKEWFNKTYGN
jgi:hypothetical protein